MTWFTKRRLVREHVEPVPARQLRTGAVIELTGQQKLWDFDEIPWTEFKAGDRLTVAEVTPLATGRTDRQPYDITLTSITGKTIRLELDSGEEVFYVVSV